MATDALEQELAASAGESTGASSLARDASSHVRLRERGPEARARRRVAEYLRALGLLDEACIAALCEEIAAASARDDAQGAVTPEHAVAEAQRRVQAFRHEVFGADEGAVQPLWLRAFLMAHPEALLESPAHARARARSFGDARKGTTTVRARFGAPAVQASPWPRWFKAAIASSAAALCGAAALLLALGRELAPLLGLVWAVLFALLLGLSAIGTATAAIGFLELRRRQRGPRGPRGRCEGFRFRQDSASTSSLPSETEKPRTVPVPPPVPPLPRSVLLMPIYHESAERVFAGLAAMRESLAATPGGEAFEIFVLSDSRDPGCAAAEERALRRIASVGDGRIPIYYRRRLRNERNKAGNLAEFFERWGDRYTYAVVLDADSLMRGDTLVELVRRMERSPRLALLQAPLRLHHGRTLFARAQQFAADVHGPLFGSGLARIAGPHGNYYGHNAVLRVRAFLDCCALPMLAGDPPLGGHLLSHDFVEAALLCRAGWHVRMATDLDGSFEQLPATLPEYVARDRRWCQGNLQHLRIVGAPGFAAMSRFHMLLGAAHYMAGPAWLVFVALGLLLESSGAAAPFSGGVAVALAAVTVFVLLLPKLLGLWARLPAADGYGGTLRLACGVAFETVLAGLLAPLMMLHHGRIVASILLGSAVRWESQRAAQRSGVRAVTRAELPATLLGAGLALSLSRGAPELLAWLSPLWGPLLLAVPIAMLASSRRAGALAARLGLFTVPSDANPDEVVLRAAELRALTMGDDAARFRDLVLDPVLLAAHLGPVVGEPPPEPAAPLARLRERALRAGPAALSSAERDRLAADGGSMRWLHCHAWRCWPVESWQLGREQPQLPAELDAAS